MNTLGTLIASISIAMVAAPAMAAEMRFLNNEIGYETVYASSKVTREQVIADLRHAQHDGELASSYEFAAPLEIEPSQRSRAQVQREATNLSDRERTAQKVMYGPNA
ncbi:MAG: DUF4148 domain-containing protein [Limnobacter sp.]|nr:DUF4148 domain-containing protein [Limnobacter sp.]